MPPTSLSTAGAHQENMCLLPDENPRSGSSGAVIEDSQEAMCRPVEESVCRGGEASVDQYVPPSHQRLYYSGTSGYQSVPTTWLHRGGELLMAAALGPAGLATSCSGPEEGTPIVGDPIAFVEPVGGEQFLNTNPIEGVIRQPVLSYNNGSRWAAAWSVRDEFSPEEHGSFVVTGLGESSGAPVQVSEDTSLHRGTSVTALDNGEAVVSYFLLRGDDVPSSVRAQRVDSAGSPLGSEIEILESRIRTQDPQVRLVTQPEGFLAVFLDVGELGVIRFNASGNEVERQTLSRDATGFGIARGRGDEWALAEIIGSNQIRVHRFQGLGLMGSPRTITTTTLSANPRVSVALQEDGSMMLAWNAFSSSGTPTGNFIEGAFLDPTATQIGSNRILRDVTEGSGRLHEGDFNSHSLTTDHRGNFVLAFEENRKISAIIYNGNREATNDDGEAIILSELSSSELPGTGPYAGLLNPEIENVDVTVGLSSDGLLSFLYQKIILGQRPGEDFSTILQAVTRQDYRIVYQ